MQEGGDVIFSNAHIIEYSCDVIPQSVAGGSRPRANVGGVRAHTSFGGKVSPRAPNKGIPLREKIISLDKNCISCSGHQQVVLKAFKMACLSY